LVHDSTAANGSSPYTVRSTIRLQIYINTQEHTTYQNHLQFAKLLVGLRFLLPNSKLRNKNPIRLSLQDYLTVFLQDFRLLEINISMEQLWAFPLDRIIKQPCVIVHQI